jgi:hypothetical protein
VQGEEPFSFQTIKKNIKNVDSCNICFFLCAHSRHGHFEFRKMKAASRERSPLKTEHRWFCRDLKFSIGGEMSEGKSGVLIALDIRERRQRYDGLQRLAISLQVTKETSG